MKRPTIVIAGEAPWQSEMTANLSADYTVVHETERSGYVARLTDARAAMILVHAGGRDWAFWTTAAKANNATRRIPVIVSAEDAATRKEALIAGADNALSPDELRDQISQLVADYARVPDAEYLQALDCGCQEPLPPLAVAGVEKFNAGEYYPQHDLFEEQWMKTESPVRDLYRAILQVGIAYYQIERGNYRGALKMLLRSVQWLLILPDECQGIDVKQLRADAARVRAELETLSPETLDQFDRTLLKPVQRREQTS